MYFDLNVNEIHFQWSNLQDVSTLSALVQIMV